MNGENKDLRELLATARAIHLSMKLGGITYEHAKLRTKPILNRINATVVLIARECNVKPRYITFQDLGVNL